MGSAIRKRHDWQSHSHRRWRRLQLERLEERHLLAQDCAVLTAPQIAGDPSFNLATAHLANCAAAGQTILIQGKLESAGQPANISQQLITINAQPVSVVDAAGNFFHRVEVLPGDNIFEIAAHDAAGNMVSQRLTVTGLQPAANAIDFESLEDVTASFAGVHRLTSYNREDKTLHVTLASKNAGQFAVAAPLLVGVTHLSDPAVRVLGIDGVTPTGIPYYDFTSLTTRGTLAATSQTLPRAITFYHPSAAAFSYDLVFLGNLNKSPEIISAPNVEAIAGRPYHYAVEATDPEGEVRQYALVISPAGMTIDADSGQISWLPATTDLGHQDVVVRVQDASGRIAEQRYSLATIAQPSNRPPVFVSVPIVAAQVDSPYRYAPRAEDADGDTLVYSLQSDIPGLTVQPASGEITWTPSAAQLGPQSVSLQVADGHGGLAVQSFTLVVDSQIGNHAPLLVSQPIVQIVLAGEAHQPLGEVSPAAISLNLALGETSTQTVSITLPGQSDSAPRYADIVLVVDESGSMDGLQAWLREMLVDLEASLVAKGIGPNRYFLVGYGQFGKPTVGHYFNPLQGSTLQAFDLLSRPTSAQALRKYLEPTYLQIDVPLTGPQWLAFSGNQVPDSTNYSFRVVDALSPALPLTLGEHMRGRLATATEQAHYSFTLTADSVLYFDDLNYGYGSGLFFTLAGPSGVVTINAIINGDYPAMLRAGEYRLTVATWGDLDYEFRLTNLAALPTATLNAPITGSLDPADETDFYRFNAHAGDRFYFDLQNLAEDAWGVRWELLDPFGHFVFNQWIGLPIGDIETMTLNHDGDYTLVVIGANTFVTTPTDYTIQILPVTYETVPLTLGSVISAEIGAIGERDRYTFELAQTTMVFLDILQGESGSRHWILEGPTGSVVHSFNQFSSSAEFNQALALPPGFYSLTIDGVVEATGAYGFRLLDLAEGTPLTAGVPTAGALTPASAVTAYTLSLQTGETLALDVQSIAVALGDVGWRLIDPYGNLVAQGPFDNAETSDRNDIVAPVTGAYGLLIEGYQYQAGPVDYLFAIEILTTLPPPPLQSTPLVLGAMVNASISQAGDQQRYGFSLTTDSLLYFDSLTDRGDLQWSLATPTGVLIDKREFDKADGLHVQNDHVLALGAGDYTLTVVGLHEAIGDYQFRLFDLATSPPLNVGVPIQQTLSPANSAVAYRFSAAAHERFYIDREITNAPGVTWKLIDPYGTVVFSPFASIESTFELALPGEYTLLIEGEVALTGSVDVVLDVHPVTFSNVTLPIGSDVVDSIHVAGAQDRYTFTVPSRGVYYFDSLSVSPGLHWTLRWGGGEVVSQRSFSDPFNAPLELWAGAYELVVAGTTAATGEYSFRLLAAPNAAPLSLTAALVVTSSPANRAGFYRFSATAGDLFLTSNHEDSGLSGGSRTIIDPFGRIVNAQAQWAAQYTGVYTVLIEAALPPTQTWSYRLSHQPIMGPSAIAAGGLPLVIGAAVAGTLVTSGEQRRFTFSLTTPGQFMFDSLSASAEVRWTLAGPRGVIVSGRPFDLSDGLTNVPVLELTAGDYTLIVETLATGIEPFSFRLLDLAAATEAIYDATVSGALSPANGASAFRFNATSGDQIVLEASSATGAAIWRLIDPDSRIIAKTTDPASVGTLGLTLTGTYTLIVEGAIDQTVNDSYSFTIHLQGNVPLPEPIGTPLTLATIVKGALADAAAQNAYYFFGRRGQTLFFDGLDSGNGSAMNIVRDGTTLTPASTDSNTGPIVLPETGLYQLYVTTGGTPSLDYSFRVLDLAAARVIGKNEVISGVLPAGQATDFFTFDATAGQTLVVTPGKPQDIGGSLAQTLAAAAYLVADGAAEDGYEAIEVALQHGGFRPGAAVNVILVTDEGRSLIDPEATPQSTLTSLQAHNALLNSVIRTRYEDENHQLALGADARGNAYLADGQGNYLISSGATNIPGAYFAGDGRNESSDIDYVDFTWQTGGATWDLMQLYEGGLNATSFTRAFVDVKTQEIMRQFELEVMPSDPRVNLVNVTGPIANVGPGDTATFEVRFTGDGAAHRFDLLFVRPPGIVLGSVPVSLAGASYSYRAEAIDADGDALNFRLLQSPVGATMDPQSGRIAWQPPALGTYPFTVRVEDGRGGFDEQTFVVEVVATNSPGGEIRGTSYHDLNQNRDWDFVGSQPQPAPVDPAAVSILLLTASGLPNAVGGVLEEAGFVVIAAPLAPDSIAASLAAYPTIDQIWVWADETLTSLSTAPADPSRDFSAADLAALTTFHATHTQWVMDGLSSRGQFNPDGKNLTLNVAHLLAQYGGGILLGTDDGITGGLLKQHVNQVAAHFGFELWAGIYDTMTAALHAGGELLHQPYSVVATNLGSTTSYSEVPHGLQPNGIFLATSIFGSPSSINDQEPASPPLVGAILDHTYASVNHLVTSTIPGAGIDSIREPGLNGWVVFLDQNENGRRDLGERFTTTDSQGRYTFENLAPGRYIVVEEVQAGWAQTAPGGKQQVVDIADGQFVANADFGHIPALTTANRRPTFVSSAPLTASANQLYRYDIQASDPDFDDLRFDLPVHPPGMSVSATGGELLWEPGPDLVGQHQVVLRVSDGRGGVALQHFQLIVSPPNTPPRFVSVPTPGSVAWDFPYQFPVRAQDADGDVLHYGLLQAPAGLTIDAATGLLRWSPWLGPLGTHAFTIVVNDGRGGSLQQPTTLEVVAETANVAPVIRSTPRLAIGVGANYRYLVDVVDNNGDPWRLAVLTGPFGLQLSAGALNWTPTASDVGEHLIELQVDDNRGGIATQSFVLQVVAQSINRAPRIISSPGPVAIVGRPFEYLLVATDADDDAILWNLDRAPRGVSLDPRLGVLAWTPAPDQTGPQSFEVSALDGQGGMARQTFVVQVRAINTPPQVVSVPPTRGFTGVPLSYAVRALDIDGDALQFTLAGPSTMSIDRATGVLRWTPSDAEVGIHEITVIVSDGQSSNRQVFDWEIDSEVPNQAPVITSRPVQTATAAVRYEYPLAAFDPEQQVLRYQLFAGPAGMTIDAGSGMVAWTPTAGQLGEHLVAVGAVDPRDSGSYQQFVLRVLGPNQAPTIQSSPPLSVAAGARYRYDVRATDPDAEQLAYRLLAAPTGMSIDARLGRILWETANSDIGSQAVELQVLDERGAVSSQNFVLHVQADTSAPQVVLLVTENPIDLGASVSVEVRATDNVGVVTLQLFLGGVVVPLDSQGRARIETSVADIFVLTAIATDAAGLTTTVREALVVRDPTDLDAPQIAIDSPGDEVAISAPVAVIGSVQDDSLLYYTLAISLLGTDDFQEIGRGTQSIEHGVLGRFDPSLLPNDVYVLRLTAFDAGGHESFIDRQVSVIGDLKLGNFTLSFADLTLPVAGVPITVARTYDTLNADRAGELGYGWRLEFRDAQLRTSVQPTDFEADLLYNPFTSGTRVYVTLPGGRREGFTFRPKPSPGYEGSFLGLYRPAFEADAGVTNELTVDPFSLSYDRQGNLLEYSSSLPYNPGSPAFGGHYVLTTPDGIAYDINPSTGQIDAVIDPHDNRLTFSDQGIASSTGVNVTFERDLQGRIIGVVDPLGQKVRYAYDAVGNLASVTDRAGSTTQFFYTTPSHLHYLSEVRDPLGNQAVRTEYDDEGRVSRVLDAGGNALRQLHDPEHARETVIDQLGHATVFEYDDRGNVLIEIDALNGVTRRVYDANNNLLTETDPLGNVTTYTYDERGNTLTEVDPLGNITLTTHQSFNRGGRGFATYSQPLTTTDALGHTIVNAYDAQGNLLTIVGQATGPINLTYDARGNPLTLTGAAGDSAFEYDGAGRLVRQTDALGSVTRYEYDAAGRQIRETKSLTTPTGMRSLVTTTEYDAEGRVVKVTDAEGGISRTQYNAAGVRIAVIDPLGRITRFVYDVRGSLVETVFPDATPATDADNPRTRSEYDAAGRLAASIDEQSRRTEYRYDALNRLIETIYPDATPLIAADNPRTRTEYDAAGRTIASIDELGHRTDYRFDAAGRQFETILPDDTPASSDDNPRVRTEYDAVGRQLAAVDPLGHRTEYVYSDAGQLTETVFVDGTRTLKTYDARGLLAAVTDQAGRVTHYEYDAAHRLAAVVDALQQRTEYAYDEAGNLILQRDANGHVTRYEYDGLNRRIATVLPLNQRSSVMYDAVGHVVSRTDFNGVTVTQEYDPRDRLLAIHYPDQTAVAFAYTPAGQRASVVDGHGTTTYTYDGRDHLLARVDPDGQAISYTYDAAGNRISLITAAGETQYAFDAQNRLSQVTDPAGGATRYAYDLAGRLLRTDFPNSTVETRQYDALHHLKKIETMGPQGVIVSFAYTLDPTGNRTAVVEHDGRRVDYAYDDLYRLLGETIDDPTLGDRTITYVYDPVGNRLTRDDSAEGLTAYTYDANDRLLTETLAGDIARYTYDNNGNTLSKASAADSVFYDWDFENRLVSADTDGDGNNDVVNRYDANGIRVAQIVGGEETRYLIDTVQPYQQVVLEYRPSGVIVASYVYGKDLVSQARAGSTSIYQVDGLGSTRVLMNALGVVTDRYVYDAFGRTIKKTGNTSNHYLFGGEQRDVATGLDYLRARFSDTSVGRFSSRDSFEGLLRSPLSRNSYIYADGNPANYIDPNGKFSIAEFGVGQSIQSVLQAIGRPVFTQIAKSATSHLDLLVALSVMGGMIYISQVTGFDAGFWAFTIPVPSIDAILQVTEKTGWSSTFDARTLTVEINLTPKDKLFANTTQNNAGIVLGIEFRSSGLTFTGGVSGGYSARLVNYPSQSLAIVKVDGFVETTINPFSIGASSGKLGLAASFLRFVGVKGGYDWVQGNSFIELTPML